MLLATLKEKLSVITGTHLQEVIFNWKYHDNVKYTKRYPLGFWTTDNMTFENVVIPGKGTCKEYKLNFLVLANFKNKTDQIAEWDICETYALEYLNAINTNDQVVEVVGIDKLKGSYIPEAIFSAECEVGVMYQDIIVRTYC